MSKVFQAIINWLASMMDDTRTDKQVVDDLKQRNREWL